MALFNNLFVGNEVAISLNYVTATVGNNALWNNMTNYGGSAWMVLATSRRIPSSTSRPRRPSLRWAQEQPTRA
jgi:hypothetical protein